MKLIITDLELNQPSNKIIQIGSVCVDTRSHKVLSIFNKLCNPGELPDQYITDLTKITPEQVSAAQPLAEVLTEHWNWFTNQGVNKRLGDWGTGDYAMLTKQSAERGVQIPERIKFIDIKLLAGILRESKGSKLKGGLLNTLKLFELQFYPSEAYCHNALYDAYNTARILFKIEEYLNFAVSTSKKFHEIQVRNLKQADTDFTDLIKEFNINRNNSNNSNNSNNDNNDRLPL